MDSRAKNQPDFLQALGVALSIMSAAQIKMFQQRWDFNRSLRFPPDLWQRVEAAKAARRK